MSRRIKNTSQLIRKYLRHPNYNVLMKLGNIMKVELLNLSFSKEDALKIVSKIKKKFLAYNISGITLYISYAVNSESINIVHRKQ